MTKPTETLVPVATLRTICGKDAPELDAMLKSGQIKAKGGQVPLVSSVRTFLAAVRAGAADADLGAAQTAARTARAEAAELAMSVERRALIPDHEADGALLAVAGAIISQFAALPAMTTRDIRDRKVVEDIVYEAQVRLAEAIAAADLALPAEPAKAKTKGKAR